MSNLPEYLLGQLMRQSQSLESGQRRLARKVDKLTEEVEEAISWGQRIILLWATWLAAIGLNISPEKAGELLAGFLHGLK